MLGCPFPVCTALPPFPYQPFGTRSAFGASQLALGAVRDPNANITGLIYGERDAAALGDCDPMCPLMAGRIPKGAPTAPHPQPHHASRAAACQQCVAPRFHVYDISACPLSLCAALAEVNEFAYNQTVGVDGSQRWNRGLVRGRRTAQESSAAHACRTAMAACKARQASEALLFPFSDHKLRASATSKPHCAPALP